MADIRAFRGWRYNLDRDDRLSDLVAPPYDVISLPQQGALCQQHPHNVVRLILDRPTDADTDQDNPYTRAAATLQQWQAEDVLVREAQPAMYVCKQTYQVAGQMYVRRGFMAAVRLEELGQGCIYAHEQTLAGPKQDRLRLTRATRMHLSPVFGLYPDPKGQVLGALRAGLAKTSVRAQGADGACSELWPVTNADRVEHTRRRLASAPVFIADGHHRYETACNYRRELADAGALTGDDHPAHFVPMMLVAMSDPGLTILPTHRLISGLGPVTYDELADALAQAFDCQPLGEGIDLAGQAWDALVQDGQATTLALYAAADRTWMLARLKDPAAMADCAPDHSPAWQMLGVSVLHALVLDRLVVPRFGQTGELDLAYVHSLDEVQQELTSDRHQMAALVRPATMHDVQEIAAGLESMPPKTTYFSPKILSGLVLHDLSGEGP